MEKSFFFAGLMLTVTYILEVFYPETYFFNYSAAVAAGMQNAMFSRY